MARDSMRLHKTEAARAIRRRRTISHAPFAGFRSCEIAGRDSRRSGCESGFSHQPFFTCSLSRPPKLLIASSGGGQALVRQEP